MQFTRLRLSGFKSFVEPTEFVIHPGLTGVVGPNGCGKSNLVEALRWVMGENSPKRMRGSAMDDVIFSGTTTRAARNVAEVALHLLNDDRRAPAEFNDAEELEICRRIERESGSAYRINGRDSRARDVQLLFADLATGAHSTAMVSQGRIGALISAKPVERRALLEEAAGISGLHSRRHEAELRLRHAETNLERVSDMLGQLDAQLTNLKKQARQASRYRNIQEQVRQNEAMLFFLRLTGAQAALNDTREALTQSEGEVVTLTERAAALTVAEAEAAEAVPGPRQAEAETAAKLHRLIVARDGLDAEEARAVERLNEIGRRINQTDADLERERALARDAAEALARIDRERDTIVAAQGSEEEDQAAAEEVMAERGAIVEECQGRLDALNQRLAQEGAERQRLTRAIAEAEQRLARLTERLNEVAVEIARLEAEASSAVDPEAVTAEVEELSYAAQAARDKLQTVEDENRRTLSEVAAQARAAIETAEGAARQAIENAQAAARHAIQAAEAQSRQTIEAAQAVAREAIQAGEQRRAAAEQAQQGAREALNQREAALARLTAEEAGLAKLLATKDDDLWPPLIDAVTVAPGYEKALGAALGDDLQVATDTAAPAFWTDLGPAPSSAALPDGVVPLSQFVTGPAVLTRRLAQIGVVEDGQGAALQARLAQGQRLVTKAGALWRWDGFTATAGAPSAAAARLEQRNRLAELRADLDLARAARDEAAAMFDGARAETEAAKSAETIARDEARAAESNARATAQAAEAAARSHAQAEEAAARDAAKAAEAAARDQAHLTETALRDEAANAERAAREAVTSSEQALAQARDFHAKIAAQAGQRAARLHSLRDAEANARRDADEAEIRVVEDRAALDALPPADEARQLLDLLRPELEGARRAAAEARGLVESLRRDAQGRAHRLEALGIEYRSWANRAENAERQLAELMQRRALAHAEREDNAARPAEIAAQRETLADDIAIAEEERAYAAAQLAEAESRLSQLSRDLRECERALSAARELKARRDSDAVHGEEVLRDLVLRLHETLDVAPDEVWALTGHDESAPLPEVTAVETKLDRLKRERENMGPVNLRAEIEAEEVAQQFDSLTGEKDDLVGAIDRLRQGINSLNKEGRERLVDAFQKVNEHFGKLFVRVFGGGSAHLQFVESDDPLEAGLEIMASPPGKKLQVLSLLSGGEQALTALSLLFAVFLTNPAPICVLDEVDAPLDDANVERMCNLLDEIAGTGTTRFLVVTHHPVTMARMDRLFGVTMAERGVSHLVSVDLAGAEAMRASA